MFKAFGTFIEVILLVLLIVLLVMFFWTFGFASPFPWIIVAMLAAFPWLHKKINAKKYLEWKDSYSVGIEQLDNDHKKLLNLINQLQTSVDYFMGREFEESALDALVDYTKTHFKREEDMMQEYDYPDYEAHKMQHQKMIDKVDALITSYKSDSDATIHEALDYLKNWLINHINGTDKEYSGFFNSKGIH